MDVPRVVREVLDRTGLKQAEFAKKVGVAQGTVSKWLSDGQSPNKRQWDKAVVWIGRQAKTRDLVAPTTDPVIYAPVLTWVSAGKLADAESQIPVEDVPLLAFADLGRGEFFALRVEGDSMDRLSPDGSIIVVNRAIRDLTADKPFIFSLRGETTYKLWRPDPPHLAPHSWNGAHKPIFVKGKKDFEVVGRVRRTVLDL